MPLSFSCPPPKTGRIGADGVRLRALHGDYTAGDTRPALVCVNVEGDQEVHGPPLEFAYTGLPEPSGSIMLIVGVVGLAIIQRIWKRREE